MNSNNSLILANVQNKIAILENAITQLIDMQTMLHLELQVIKKKTEGKSSSKKKQDHDAEENDDDDDDDLDIKQIQNALRNNSSASTTIGRKILN
jgi:hypothetical protein